MSLRKVDSEISAALLCSPEVVAFSGVDWPDTLSGIGWFEEVSAIGAENVLAATTGGVAGSDAVALWAWAITGAVSVAGETVAGASADVWAAVVASATEMSGERACSIGCWSNSSVAHTAAIKANTAAAEYRHIGYITRRCGLADGSRFSMSLHTSRGGAASKSVSFCFRCSSHLSIT